GQPGPKRARRSRAPGAPGPGRQRDRTAGRSVDPRRSALARWVGGTPLSARGGGADRGRRGRLGDRRHGGDGDHRVLGARGRAALRLVHPV
ncbi:MAG: hypothetical protein AVDCRST_MAG19-1571, partial [uncultured Thermomicrobiales bacterium]